MGGNAVKGARRFKAVEFFEATNVIVKALRSAFDDRRIHLIPSIRTKADFGDADILFERDSLNHDWMETVKSVLSPIETVHNGDVWSFNVNSLQVDLILTPSRHYEFSYNYFSYNDVGNLVGRVAHLAKLKFGHKGLYKPLRDGNYLHEEVLITNDFAKALELLGYEAKPYLDGFDTLEQIFWYVTTSPYFDPWSYDLGNMSHTARVRDKKRPTYRSFLQWLEDQGFVGRAATKQRTEEEWLEAAIQEFPEFSQRWLNSKVDLAHKQVIKTKFNGKLVTAITGFTDHHLGKFMANYREHMGGTDKLNAFVLNATDSEIQQSILSYSNHYSFHNHD